jgi:cytochrome c556
MRSVCKTLLTTLVLFTLGTLSVRAESDPEQLIKYRQNVMKAAGGHAGAITAIVRGKVEYADQLLAHARALNDITQSIPSLFPEDSDFGETHAKAEVWDKPKEFEQAAEKAAQASEAFLQAVQEGADKKTLRARLRDVGDGCKGCHKEFREKEE